MHYLGKHEPRKLRLSLRPIALPINTQNSQKRIPIIYHLVTVNLSSFTLQEKL